MEYITIALMAVITLGEAIAVFGPIYYVIYQTYINHKLIWSKVYTPSLVLSTIISFFIFVKFIIPAFFLLPFLFCIGLIYFHKASLVNDSEAKKINIRIAIFSSFIMLSGMIAGIFLTFNEYEYSSIANEPTHTATPPLPPFESTAR